MFRWDLDTCVQQTTPSDPPIHERACGVDSFCDGTTVVRPVPDLGGFLAMGHVIRAGQELSVAFRRRWIYGSANPPRRVECSRELFSGRGAEHSLRLAGCAGPCRERGNRTDGFRPGRTLPRAKHQSTRAAGPAGRRCEGNDGFGSITEARLASDRWRLIMAQQ